jgi:hypothetical protein
VSKPDDGPAGADRVLRTSVYLDAEGNRTHDPGKAVGGEILERDGDGRGAKRTWFRIQEVQLKWLPVSEAAFLLWVLALLVFVWLVAALILFVL